MAQKSCKINYSKIMLKITYPKSIEEYLPKNFKSRLKTILKKDLKNIRVNRIEIHTLKPAEITKLNSRLFSRNIPTDVISVNLDEFSGEIFLCEKQIKLNAKNFNISVNEEMIRIIVHGILHLAGFDHKKAFEANSKEKMYILQEKITSNILT